MIDQHIKQALVNLCRAASIRAFAGTSLTDKEYKEHSKDFHIALVEFCEGMWGITPGKSERTKMEKDVFGETFLT